MAENNQNSSYTCDHAIKYNGTIIFGQRCVKSVQSYIESQINQLNIQNPEDLPSCDSVCDQFGDHQVKYNEFTSISVTTLESFCDDLLYCGFNVSVQYDYENRVWRNDDGTVLDDLIWSSNDFPKYKDLITLHLKSYTNPSYLVESSSPNNTKIRDESNAEVHELADNPTGYFFCAEDEITKETLKLGTYTEARHQCSKILTPDVCEDPNFSDSLLNLATRKSSSGDMAMRVRLVVILNASWQIYNLTKAIKILDWNSTTR